MSRIEAKMAGAGGSERKVMPVDQFLVWVYQVQKADVVMEHGVSLNRVERLIANGLRAGDRTMTTDSTALVEALAMGAGGQGVSNALHPDAETTHELVRAMAPHARQLTIECARGATQPDWCEGKETRLTAQIGRDGTPRVVWSKNGDYPLYCPVDVQYHPALIDMRRDIYVMWWDALAQLALMMKRDSRLIAHAITMPRCQRTPWISMR